jgi:hypothetical protein
MCALSVQCVHDLKIVDNFYYIYNKLNSILTEDEILIVDVKVC